LAVATAGVLALSGMAGLTSSAMAEEPAEQCSGAGIPPAEHVLGEGSSLQKVAQAIWDDEESLTGKGFNNSEYVGACNGKQGLHANKPVVLYNSTGSGAGRLAWGAEEPLNKPKDGKKMNPAESGDAFVGTDEPLSEAQLKNLDEAAGGKFKEAGKEQALVIPVEQAAVAVIVNMPANCDLTKITNGNLQKIWNGEITEWSGVTGGAAEEAGVTELVAGACKVAIERVVRKDVSGTTFVFKTYLNEILKGEDTCAGAGPPLLSWAHYAEPEHNLEWPEELTSPPATCKGEVIVATENGGGGEVKEVKALTGTIGYANLADARAGYTEEVGNNYHWLGVQNQAEPNLYPFPGTSTGEPSKTTGESNCKGTHYTNLPTAPGPDDDWSKVNGAHPGTEATNKNANYPICTLTYDVALVSYEEAGFAESNKIGTTAYNYLNYVVTPSEEGAGGQADLAGHDYLEVEEAVGKFAQEEAELIAGGSRLDYSVGGAVITLLLFSGPLPQVIDLMIKNLGPKVYLISLEDFGIFTPAGSGGVFETTQCEVDELGVNGECLVNVTALKAGLAYLVDWLQIRLHLEA